MQPAVYSISMIGPYNVQAPGDSPSRRRILRLSPASRRERRCLRANDPARRWRAARIVAR